VRDKSAVDFDYKRLQHVRLSVGDREVATLERDGLTKWNLSVPDGPPGLEADPRHVEELFQLLQAMAPVDATSATLAVEPLPTAPKTPQVTIELVSRSGATRTLRTPWSSNWRPIPPPSVRLRPGAAVTGYTGVTTNQVAYRAKLGDRALLFEADSRLARALLDPLHTFRDRRGSSLFPRTRSREGADRSAVGRVDERPWPSSVLPPSEPWRFASEADRPFNQPKATNTCRTFKRSKVDSFRSSIRAGHSGRRGSDGAPVPSYRRHRRPLARRRLRVAAARGQGLQSLLCRAALIGSGKQIAPSAIVTLALAEAHVAKLCRRGALLHRAHLLSFDSERVARLEVGLLPPADGCGGHHDDADTHGLGRLVGPGNRCIGPDRDDRRLPRSSSAR